jgi:hypothetical protein
VERAGNGSAAAGTDFLAAVDHLDLRQVAPSAAAVAKPWQAKPARAAALRCRR